MMHVLRPSLYPIKLWAHEGLRITHAFAAGWLFSRLPLNLRGIWECWALRARVEVRGGPEIVRCWGGGLTAEANRPPTPRPAKGSLAANLAWYNSLILTFLNIVLELLFKIPNSNFYMLLFITHQNTDKGWLFLHHSFSVEIRLGNWDGHGKGLFLWSVTFLDYCPARRSKLRPLCNC